MISVTTRNGQNIALFGLGGSGLVTAEALVAGGANVVAFDDNPDRVREARARGIPCQDLREYDFANCDAFVLSPGVPLTHPKPHWSVERANLAQCPILGDVELFAGERRKNAPESKFIAITGTNGKSTTTAIVAHILKASGKNVQMGGNIGRAVLSLDALSNDAFYVVECSSYQIDLAPTLDPTVGILLNLSPDHLDRHGTMEHYADIKSRLVEGCEKAIVGIDDEHSAAIFSKLLQSGDPVAISTRKRVEAGCYHLNGQIEYTGKNGSRATFTLAGAETLRGSHNAQNAMAAICGCLDVGLSSQDIQAGLNSFPGLAHRMEILGYIDNVVFVNDSKATNADAAAMALASFDNIYWIAGGLAKEGGIDRLRELFARVKKAYLIGESAPEFAATLGSSADFELAASLENAVLRAAQDSAGKKGAVLLSPASASFDQFPNFEVRGEAFRNAVNALAGFVPYGGE